LDNNLCASCSNNQKAEKITLEMASIKTNEDSCKTGCDVCMAIRAFAIISSGLPLSVLTDRLAQESPDQLISRSVH
jgi:hypothetical protein